MHANSLYLIAAAEIAGLLLLVCVFLVFQNRSLRRVVRKLQERMEQLVQDLKLARAARREKPQESGPSYKQMLDKQLEQIRDHHQSLGNEQDIVLDIDPETPLPRRVAALRYAILLTEKEAASANPHASANWKMLERKYEQLFRFNQDYSGKDSSAEGELDALREELTAAKKRINNLERFKALYFDLEEKWQDSKHEAKSHFDSLTQLTASADNADEIEAALHAYHNSYGDLGRMIEAGVDGATIISGTQKDETAGELRHLRAVAADQHKIITELQRKLREASTAEAREEVVTELQGQLQKQIRFVQESETCIQLLEDELTNANKELEQLRGRLNQLPQVKTELKLLRDQNDDYELQMYALKSENRRLTSKMQQLASAPPPDDNENRQLKKALMEMESRYAELEEKFLDLKLQQ